MAWEMRVPTDGCACRPPTEQRYLRIPVSVHSNSSTTVTLPAAEEPAGSYGDLWRCDNCRRLWQIGNSCPACHPRRPGGRCVLGGYHPGGMAWYPASWWQRLFRGAVMRRFRPGTGSQR